MKKPFSEKAYGFASILPLLVVAFLIVSGFAVYNQTKVSSTASESILGESNDEDNDLNGNSEQAESEAENIEDESETPEPRETSEPRDDEDEVETEDELEDEEESEVEIETEVKDGTTESKIKIRNGKNKFEFQQEGAKFSIESDFPLSVDPDTGELTVTTPAGSNVVAILPQQAIDKMLASGVVSATSRVHLKTEADGSLTYNIDGSKDEKLLGVFNVAVPKSLIVSAETGQVLTVNQTTFSKILDFLSISSE